MDKNAADIKRASKEHEDAVSGGEGVKEHSRYKGLRERLLKALSKNESSGNAAPAPASK